MKKKIIIWLIVLAILGAVIAFTVVKLANEVATESHESYVTTAYISYEMDLTREIEVDDYMTYSNGLIRIFDKDGVEYLTNSKNVILIKEHEKNDE